MHQVELEEVRSWLINLLQAKLSESGRTWLTERYRKLDSLYTSSKFHLAFGAAPRFVGKGSLSQSEEELAKAQEIRQGLRPDTWTADETARILFLLLLPNDSAETHYAAVMDVFDTADMGEQAALFKAFPLLPYPEQYQDLAAEGIRTNMTVVLEAIALNNPYPAEFLEENAWNQLFLKCTFTDRPLHKIQGINLRENPELARIISDYAHERWSAGREVTPEIWCPVGPYFAETHLEDMKKLLEHSMPIQREAAALLCIEAGTKESISLISGYPALKDKVLKGEITWEGIGKKWETQKLTVMNE
ncbi:MAG: EboA domain-containing protein [Bacteroidota bacterium]